MKLSKLLTFILILFCGSIYSQQGWFWQNPLPQGNFLNGISYVNSSIVYVSGYGGTLMKSTNGGVNFTVIQTGLRDNLAVKFINELTGFSGAYGGLLKTTDGGYTWQYIPAPVTGISQAVMTPILTLYSLTENKIYRSTDSGFNWTVSLDPGPNYVSTFNFADNLTGYALGRKGTTISTKCYKTTNGGVSWDSIASNIRSSFSSSYFLNSNTGYVTTGTIIRFILRTTNGCLSWDTLYNLGNNAASFTKFFNSSEGYVKTSGNIVRTTNSGLNWQELYTGIGLTLVNVNDGMGVKENRVLRTTNSGANWIEITQGFNEDLLDVTFINEFTGFTIGYNRIYKSTNGGSNWQEYYLGLQGWPPYLENIMFVNSNTGYAGIDGGRLAKTTNCGTNWVVYETGCYDHNHGMSFPCADTGYAVTKYGFYLKTTNGGVNWINFGQIENHSFGDVYFVNNNTGFAAGDSFVTGPVIRKGILRKTTNGGSNWSTSYIDSVQYFHDAFAVNQTTWFAAGERSVAYESIFKGIIVKSTDSGNSWVQTLFPARVTAIHFPTSGVGYASTSGSVIYKTTNSGESWLPTECINASESYGIFFINENTGWASGAWGQIIKTTTGGGAPIGIQPLSSVIPEEFMLFQNYPNPFNPFTNIKFNIPSGGTGSAGSNVQLIIYDILGREVKTLLNQNLTAGEYVVDFDASNLPSGVYFYQLISGDNSEAKKMILLK